MCPTKPKKRAGIWCAAATTSGATSCAGAIACSSCWTSSGDTQRRGALTKAGNTHVRRALIEAAWHYRHRPTVGHALAARSQGQPREVVGEAWRAQQRLHRRYRHLVGHGKRPPVAVAAVARELVGFLWAAMTQRERQAAA